MVEKNTENPLVSVIIPVYNREDMIDDAVKSVLASTYEDIEVIVVDDGSADGSVDVVRRINDERVLLLEYGENKGQSFAKNYGVSHSKGQYIAFCDSDDEWDPEKLSKQMERLISEGGRVVYCPFTKQYEDGKRTILRPGGGLKAEGDLFQ